MRIYYARHGESENASKNTIQSYSTPLTMRGLCQAEKLGYKLRAFDLHIIVASPLIRTNQTAQIIHSITQVPLVYTDHLAEEKRPTEIENKPKNNSEVKKVLKSIEENYHNPNFRYSDEDTFGILKRRGLDLINFIYELKKENVLLVGHGMMSAMFLGLLSLGPELDSYQLKKLGNFYQMSNTGLTTLDIDKKNGPRLITFDDFSHLNE